jgi:hypothetical protein
VAAWIRAMLALGTLPRRSRRREREAAGRVASCNAHEGGRAGARLGRRALRRGCGRCGDAVVVEGAREERAGAKNEHTEASDRPDVWYISLSSNKAPLRCCLPGYGVGSQSLDCCLP